MLSATQLVTNSLTLFGAISDTSGVANSGVATETVAVEVQDWQGGLVEGTRFATFDGSGWQVDYPFSVTPYGQYRVQVNAADNVGNVLTTTVGSIALDGYAPTIDVTLSQGAITETGTILTGTVGDIPYPVEGKTLHLHFEEADGVTTFADGSRNHFAAICTNCPTAGQSGPNGQAIDLDGSNWLQIGADDRFDLDGGFTIAVWVKPDNWLNGSDTPFVVKGDGSSNSEANYYFGKSNSGDQGLMLSYYDGGWIEVSDDSGVSYNNGQWYHLAVVVDTVNNQVSFYRDGQLLSTQSHDFTAQPLPINDNDLGIGRYLNSSQYFDGMLDELVIYDHTLTDEAIYDIANPLETTIQQAQIRFRHAENATDGENDGTWFDVTLASTGDNYTTWQYPLPDLEGPYKIDLKATDELGNSTYFPNAWSGDIDVVAPELTFSYGLINSSYARTSCAADDYNITTTNWLCPAEGLTYNLEDAAWFVNIFSPITKTTGLSTSVQMILTAGAGVSALATASMTACDEFNHCATQTITNPQTLSEVVAIITPTHTSVFIGLNPIEIGGLARSFDPIESLVVTANGQPIYTWTGSTAELNWTATWTPTVAGIYTLEAVATTIFAISITDPAETVVTVGIPDVAISKSVSPTTTVAGRMITYTLAFSNASGETAQGIVITDIIPSDIIVQNVTSSGDVAITPTVSSQTVQGFDIAPLASGQGGLITITAQVGSDVSVGTIITNSAIISHSSGRDSDEAVLTTILQAESNKLYLPLMFKQQAAGPDLVVDEIVATTSQVTITIRNDGTEPVSDAFWVDVYFNPSQTPSLNQPWDTIAPAGAVWGVTKSLAPGESLILTVGDAYYMASDSSSSFLAGAMVYAFVDSVNFGTTYGNVPESDEENNLSEPATSKASGVVIAPSNQAASRAGLPERK